MPKFCPKCGKKLKAGAKFCPSCGGESKVLKPTAKKVRPVYPPSPVPAKKGGMGCETGCAIGCLVIGIITFLIIAALIGVGYYFLFMRETEEGGYFDIESESKKQKVVKCDDSVSCLDDNLKKCARAKGETEIGDFAEVDLKILGKSDDSCVVYAEVTKIKDIPSQLEIIPSFILDKILESFSMECLIPKKVYTQGLEDTREYIADNMLDACRGTTIDLLKKFGVEEFEYD